MTADFFLTTWPWLVTFVAVSVVVLGPVVWLVFWWAERRQDDYRARLRGRTADRRSDRWEDAA